MNERCVIVLCAFLTAAVAAPSVFQRNGLQREQESAPRREPFDPLSPFHQNSPSNVNVQTGNTLVVPPTVDVDTTFPKRTLGEGYQQSFMNHFEILNKDALVGLLIEKDIPFYVKTIVEPQKPIQTKIHVMRIPKKSETTSPLPDVNLNLVEVISNDTTTEEKGLYNADTLKKVESALASRGDSVSKVMDRRPEDVSTEQEVPLISVTGKEKEVRPEQSVTSLDTMQGDDPNAAGTPPPVPKDAVIYTPEKDPNHKSIWDHIGEAYDKTKTNLGEAYDKAKDKTKELAGKAKEKIDPLLVKAREKAKDVLDSNESKDSKETVVRPEDDI